MTFHEEPRFGSQPFNNPSAHPELVDMWRSVIRKAQQNQEQKTPLAQTAALIINFDGAGQPLTVGMGGIPEMPPGAFRIMGVHMAAGIWNPTDLRIVPIITTASVDIRLASNGMWQGGARPLYANTRPGLVAQAEAEIDISAWVTELQPGDLISYALATFSGTASVLTLTLTLRRLDVTGLDAPTANDTTGTAFTDASGLAFTLRT